jgi:hypothetical protein
MFSLIITMFQIIFHIMAFMVDCFVAKNVPRGNTAKQFRIKDKTMTGWARANPEIFKFLARRLNHKTSRKWNN